MTPTPNTPRSDWGDCPPGALTGYAGRMHRRQLLKLAAKTAGATGCAAIIGFGGWTAYLRRLETEYQFYGLTCADVRDLMPDYRAGKLDATRSGVLERHVRRCPQCARFREELRTEVT
jgi:hypothetical protein